MDSVIDRYHYTYCMRVIYRLAHKNSSCDAKVYVLKAIIIIIIMYDFRIIIMIMCTS